MRRLQLILGVSFLFFLCSWGAALASIVSLGYFSPAKNGLWQPHDLMFYANLLIMFSTMFKYGGSENFSPQLAVLRFFVVVSYFFAIAAFRQSSSIHWQDSYLLYYIPFAVSNYILLIYSQPARWLELSTGNVYTEHSRWGSFISKFTLLR